MKLTELSEQIVDDLSEAMIPVLKALKADMIDRIDEAVERQVNKLLRERLETERSFTRQIVKAEVEPLKARERKLSEKLARIDRLIALSGARGMAG